MARNGFKESFWRQVRADYLKGMTQKDLREKYNLGASTLHNRLKREKWDETKEEPVFIKEQKIVNKPRPTTIEKNEQIDNLEKIYKEKQNIVKILVLAGNSNSVIAEVVGISEQVFESLFAKEIKETKLLATANVVQALYNAASNKEKPNVQAQKLWLEMIDNDIADSKILEAEITNPFLVDFDAPKGINE